MKKIIMVLVGLLFLVSVVEAKNDVKIVNFDQFFNGLSISKNLDFVHEGRLLSDYLIVKMPAKTLTVKTVYRISSLDNIHNFLILTNQKVVFKLEGEASKYDANINILYFCYLSSEYKCRERLSHLLVEDIELQSLGITNSDRYEKYGEVPKEFIFSFLLNENGKFKVK